MAARATRWMSRSGWAGPWSRPTTSGLRNRCRSSISTCTSRSAVRSTPPFLAAECTDGCHFNAAEWLRHGACDRLRTSWFFKGGFTGGLKVTHLDESFQVQADVHGGGMGSLHLVCALPNSFYCEAIVLEQVLPDATVTGPIRPDENGWVYPSEVPVIGWEPDPVIRVD